MNRKLIITLFMCLLFTLSYGQFLDFLFGRGNGRPNQNKNQVDINSQLNVLDQTEKSLIDRNILNSKNFFNTDRTHDLLLVKLRKFSRSNDGANNNEDPDKNNFGATQTTLSRIAKASYIDNIDLPVTNRPNARLISNTVGKQAEPIPNHRLNISVFFTTWGQFIDHDISSTPGFQQEMSIKVPPGDPFFDPSATGTQQLSFFRGAFQRNTAPRKHLNFITSWLDGSQIYGSDKDRNTFLRTLRDGKMKTNPRNLLPQTASGDFIAGDGRATENMALTCLHILFLREHNRIATQTKNIFPTLSDNEIFNIARNYVVALLNKITFEDFLPIVVGPEMYSLNIGNYPGYNPQINPSLAVQFTTAAYRFGHPLLPSNFKLISSNRRQELVKLTDLFQNVGKFRDITFFERLLRGMAKTPTKQRNGALVDGLRNLLALDPSNRQFKQDLFSLNIQRGRDLGLPTYNDMREQLNINRANGFNDFAFDNAVATRLNNAYGNVNLCDLWVGIISEVSQTGGVLGKVGATIVSKQFNKLRNADRFWYERVTHYPQQIIDRIKATTLTDIIVRNTQISDLDNDVFLLP